MRRIDIGVNAFFSQDGKVKPLSIVWEDGRTFEIDRVTDRRRAASLKTGGIGIRFTCFIRDRRIYLYKDEDKWFMESER